MRDTFVANFTERGDVGALFVIVQDDEVVASLWGGYADQAKQAGLCGFDKPVTLEDMYDQPRAEAALAAQAPFWVPGTQSGYHAVTIGILANGLFKRIEGRALATFVREELAGPYQLDLYVGLPDSEAHRASEIIAPPTLSSTDANPNPSRAQQAALANPVLDPLSANTRAWCNAPIPSVNGHATALPLAHLYGALANGGQLKGRKLLGAETIAEATKLRMHCTDAVLCIDARWAAGFLLNSHAAYGDTPASFGHSGWGGSFAFADPTRRLGVSYVMNAMGQNLIGDPRGMALVAATLASADA